MKKSSAPATFPFSACEPLLSQLIVILCGLDPLVQGHDSTAGVIWTIMELHEPSQWNKFWQSLPQNLSGRWETHAVDTPVSVKTRKADLPVAVWIKVSDKHTVEWKGETKEGGEQRCFMWHHHALTAAVWLSKQFDGKKLHPPGLTSTLHSLLTWVRWQSMTR